MKKLIANIQNILLSLSPLRFPTYLIIFCSQMVWIVVCWIKVCVFRSFVFILKYTMQNTAESTLKTFKIQFSQCLMCIQSTSNKNSTRNIIANLGIRKELVVLLYSRMFRIGSMLLCRRANIFFFISFVCLHI